MNLDFLCADPGDPVANLPPIPALMPGQTNREMIATLTQGCGQQCHTYYINPLGFAFEHFDGMGRLRTTDNGKPVDNRGEMPDGTMVEGPQSLKAALLARKDQFVRNLTSRMLGYALGRGLTAQDSCAVDRIVADLRENDYRAQKLIEGIILSAPFQFQAAGGKQ